MLFKKAIFCCVAAALLSTIGCAAKITATRGDLGPLSGAKMGLISASSIVPQGTYAYTGHRIRLEDRIKNTYQPEIDEYGKSKAVEILNAAGIPGLSIDPASGAFLATATAAAGKQTDAELMKEKGFTHFVQIVSVGNYWYRYLDLSYFYLFMCRIIDAQTGVPVVEFIVPVGYFSVFSNDANEKAYPAEVSSIGDNPVFMKLWRAGYQHLMNAFVHFLKTGEVQELGIGHNGEKFMKRYGEM